MKSIATLRSVLALAVLAAAPLAMAQDNAADRPPMHGANAQHHKFDRVAQVQHSLDALSTKLNLNAGQQEAWQAYAASALARAKDAASRMEERRSHGSDMRTDADTATRLERMSRTMRERADRLQRVAQDTRQFENALTSEQRTIFDLYWKAQWHHAHSHHAGTGGRPAA
jgi:hypothetical protein